MDIMLIKQWDGSFKPAYDSDYQKAKKIKVDSAVSCKITKPRNIKFHRKFFALMNLVFNNQEHYINIDHLRRDLTIASGYYTKSKSITGEEVTEAKSISFSGMSEIEFNELYTNILISIEKYFHFDKDRVRREIEQHF